jgi:hypothetical protein
MSDSEFGGGVVSAAHAPPKSIRDTRSGKLIVNGRAIDVYACISPRDNCWASCGAVHRSIHTGAFTTVERRRTT